MSTRRAFLKTAAGAAVALNLPGCARSVAPAADAKSAMASADELRAMVQNMVDMGPRLTGSSAHNRFIDWLEAQMQALGMQVIRDPYSFTRWQAREWSLAVLEADGNIPIGTAGYFPYSGSTGGAGIEGELVSIDLPIEDITANITQPADLVQFVSTLSQALLPSLQAALGAVQGGVSGAIVLVNGLVPPALTGIFAPFLSYAKSSDLATLLTSDYKRTWLGGLLFANLLDPIRQAGAAGAIFNIDASPECARGQYLPFSSPLNTLPALLVDRVVGADLRARAAARPTVRLILVADTFPDTRSDSLVGILPGASDENMILNTHTDGQNAFEENGGIACIAIARHYAAIPQAQRPRALVFSLVTGHMGPDLPQTQGFVDRFPDLIAKAACGITIEHFGATNWEDDAAGYHATGSPEFGGAFHSVTPVGDIAAQAYQASPLSGIALLRPIGNTYFGVGAPLHQAGVPSIGYLTGPNYLVTISANGEMDKLDPQRMQQETAWIIDTLHRLETVPAATLKQGVGLPGI
ncbi:MAG TPA: hypothetical protein VHE37_03330 [Nevskiaceae bacterium]|nr:hypothetical protein [Nevskiaceae bacterium]